jgi:eukaryotic-like serine/threonine-protein kinase
MLERIGNCRIVEEMASGGMAVVYRAIQDDLHRTVAIKALKTSAAAEEQLVTRFEREAQSLAALQHENIIHVYDFHREGGALFIVMEYVEGIDLYDLLDKCGRIPYDVAAVIAMQVARALDYIHFRAILHRDIKPANIMLSRQGAVKLMDFGIAQDRNYGQDLTEIGTGIGTPAYMSPEQIVGDRLDARSDIFSLGIVLYQMVTGQKPFVEDANKTVMQRIRLDPYQPVRLANPEVPRVLERIIDKCLHKQPGDRWATAQALVMALERFLAKHVEMNYHARLVLFLRDQEIIPRYEADEYLNPALGGRLATSVGPAFMAKRQQVKRGLVFHGIILAVLMLMVGIIHLAPLGSAPPPRTVLMPPPAKGYVRVVVKPWGHVAIDGTDRGTTPRADPFELTVGEHRLTITNDFYPAVNKVVSVSASGKNDPLVVRVDFEALAASQEESESAPDQEAPDQEAPDQEASGSKEK